jgi:hypothetical protein
VSAPPNETPPAVATGPPNKTLPPAAIGTRHHQKEALRYTYNQCFKPWKDASGTSHVNTADDTADDECIVHVSIDANNNVWVSGNRNCLKKFEKIRRVWRLLGARMCR